MKKQLFKAITVLITFAATNIAKAQSPNWLWANKIQSSATAINNSKLTIDNAGQTIVSGDFGGTILIGTTTHTMSGNLRSALLIKNDNIGLPIWSTNFGSFPSTGTTPIVDVKTNSTGDMYVVGTFSASLVISTDTLTSPGKIGMYLAKFDSNGNYLWAQSFSSGKRILPSDLHVDGNGIYVTGAFTGSYMTLGSIILANNFASNGTEYEDFFIAKFDLNGTPIWAEKAIGSGSGKEYGRSVTTNSNGDVFVVGDFKDGTFAAFGTYTLTPPSGSNGEDCFVVKYDATGTALWANKIGSSNIDYVKGIVLDNTDSPVVVGNFYGATFSASTLTIQNSSASTSDVFLVKLTTNGDYEWLNKVTNGSSDELSNSIAIDNNNNIIIVGSFTSPSFTVAGNTLTNSGAKDMFLVKLDENGNAILGSRAGGQFTDDATSVVTDGSNDIYVTGPFLNLIGFGTNPFLNGSLSSSANYLAKLAGGTVTSVNQISTLDQTINTIPNPANQFIQIKGIDFNEGVHLKIISIDGKIMKDYVVNESNINVSELTPGMYFIEFTDKKGKTGVTKFIKE